MKLVAFNPIPLNDPSKHYLFEDTAMPRDWIEGDIFGNVWDHKEQKSLDFTYEVRKNEQIPLTLHFYWGIKSGQNSVSFFCYDVNNPHHHYRFNLTEWARVIKNCVLDRGTFSDNFIFMNYSMLKPQSFLTQRDNLLSHNQFYSINQLYD